MNRKVNLKEEVNRINAIIENSRKINEGLYLDDKYTPDMDDTYEESPRPEPEQIPDEKMVDDERPSEKSPILDQIRKLTLQGMTELANDPDSFEFQNLKKVFMLLDKKPNNGNGQQTSN